MKNTKKQEAENPRDKEEQKEFLDWREQKMDVKNLEIIEKNMHVAKPTILKEKPSK